MQKKKVQITKYSTQVQQKKQKHFNFITSNSWSNVHFRLFSVLLPVTGAVRAGVVHTDDDEDVLEVGADVLRSKR